MTVLESPLWTIKESLFLFYNKQVHCEAAMGGTLQTSRWHDRLQLGFEQHLSINTGKQEASFCKHNVK